MLSLPSESKSEPSKSEHFDPPVVLTQLAVDQQLPYLLQLKSESTRSSLLSDKSSENFGHLVFQLDGRLQRVGSFSQAFF